MLRMLLMPVCNFLSLVPCRSAGHIPHHGAHALHKHVLFVAPAGMRRRGQHHCRVQAVASNPDRLAQVSRLETAQGGSRSLAMTLHKNWW